MEDYILLCNIANLAEQRKAREITWEQFLAELLKLTEQAKSLNPAKLTS